MRTNEIRKCGDILSSMMAKSIATGYPDLDDAMMGGWKCGTLNAVCGVPASGKTTFALDCAVNAARSGVPVLFLSHEMSQIQLVKRLIKRYAGLGYDMLQHLDSNTVEIECKFHELSELPLYIDDAPSRMTDDCITEVVEFVGKNGNSLVIVDYLQLMDEFGESGNNWSEGVDSLKRLAKRLNIAILVLAQLPHIPSCEGGVAQLVAESNTVIRLTSKGLSLENNQGGAVCNFVADFDSQRISFVRIKSTSRIE